MTVREGKSFLCAGLQKCGCATDIDELIVYKYGNIKEAVNYQHDLIIGNIDFSKVKSSVRYIVKCFIHICKESCFCLFSMLNRYAFYED